MKPTQAAGFVAALLVTVLVGCGGSDHSPWDEEGAADEVALRIGPFGVATVSGTPPTEVDFTPSTGARFTYLGLGGQEIKRLQWTCALPPPAELTPILFLGEDTDAEIYAVMPSGEGLRQLTDNDAEDGHPGWSPDGTQIVFNSTRSGNNDVWIMNAAGGEARNVTNDPATDGSPRWNPKGGWIAFKSDRTGLRDIYSIRVNGTGLRQLTDHPAFDRSPEWYPDGRSLLFSSNRDGDQDMYRMTQYGTRVRHLLDRPGSEIRGTVSPDGSKIAFRGEQDGDVAVYVMDANGSNVKKITHDPGKEAHPEWAPDGTRLVINSERSGVAQVWTLRPDGSDLQQVINDPGLLVQCVAWNVPGSKRELVGRPGLDAGYDPPAGRRTGAALAVYDANSLRSVVCIKAANGARVVVRKPAASRSSAVAYVRSAQALAVTEDRGRLLDPVVHLTRAAGVRKCLVRFSSSTGRVTAVKPL